MRRTGLRPIETHTESSMRNRLLTRNPRTLRIRITSLIFPLMLLGSVAHASEYPVIFVHGFCSRAAMWNETVQQLQAADPARFGSSAMNLYFDGKSVRRSDGVPLRKSALTTTRVWAIDFYGYNQGFNLLGIANIDIQYKAGELKEVIDAVKSITGSKKGHPCRP
jgi:hypothetical protein